MSTLFQRRYQENTRLQSVCKMIVNIIMVIVSAYVIVTFMCDRTIISGGSMQPVIENEDTVLINRFAYSFTKPKRYSVAAFKLPGSNSSKVYVKRVIGLPGEKIQIKDGHVYINGEQLKDDVYTDTIRTAGLAANEITLGKDEYFLLGDNRNNSEDSRFAGVGIVKEKNITGSVWAIVGPVKRLGFVK